MTEEETLKELEAEIAALEQTAVETVAVEQELEPAPATEATPEPEAVKAVQPKKSPKKVKNTSEGSAPTATTKPETSTELSSDASQVLYGAARIKAKLNRH